MNPSASSLRLSNILLLEPGIKQSAVPQTKSLGSVCLLVFLYVSDCLSSANHLDEPHPVPCGEGSIREEPGEEEGRRKREGRRDKKMRDKGKVGMRGRREGEKCWSRSNRKEAQFAV